MKDITEECTVEIERYDGKFCGLLFSAYNIYYDWNNSIYIV